MQTILVPLDGSVVAEQILVYLRRLAPILKAQVHLLQVVSEDDAARVIVHDGALAHELGGQTSIGHINAEQVRDVLRQHSAAYLAACATELRAAGIEVDIEVSDGSPAEQIIVAAAHKDVKLIAMATHGYSGLRRWALGSVADKVVQAAPCPIFLIRASTQPHVNTWSVRHILVPLDGSALAEQALPLAIELASQTQAELLLLQAVIPLVEYAPGLSPISRPLPPSIMFPDVLYEQAQQQLAATIDRFYTRGVVMTPVLMSGYPAEAIIDEAVQRQADLIVMATHGYSGLRRWALGSVADKVLHNSTTPLLLVHVQSEQAKQPSEADRAIAANGWHH